MAVEGSEQGDIHYRRRLSMSMVAALAVLPFDLVDGSLPPGAPPGRTLQALERRGLAECDGQRWARTQLGQAVWGRRS